MQKRSFQPGRHWSHTLGSDLSTCERRAYYRIWGGQGGWSPDANKLPRLLYTARHSKDLRSYAGTLVHEAIQRLIERLRVGMAIAPKQLWLDRFDERMRADIEYSRSFRWKLVRNPKNATLILYQHLTGADLHDWEVEEAIERAKDAFDGFFEVLLPPLRALEPSQILLIDSLDKMQFRGFDLFLSPDLVVLLPEVVEVVDWKTGVGTNGDQLAAYSWYLQDYARRNGIELKPVVGRSVPLLIPEKELRISIGPDELQSAEDRIRLDLGKLEEMATRAPLGDTAFVKTDERSHCNYCFFEFHCRLRPDRQSPTTNQESP